MERMTDERLAELQADIAEVRAGVGPWATIHYWHVDRMREALDALLAERAECETRGRTVKVLARWLDEGVSLDEVPRTFSLLSADAETLARTEAERGAR